MKPGDDDGTPACAGNQFGGPVKITNGIGAVEFDDNTVAGPLSITGNTGTLLTPDTGRAPSTPPETPARAKQHPRPIGQTLARAEPGHASTSGAAGMSAR